MPNSLNKTSALSSSASSIITTLSIGGPAGNSKCILGNLFLIELIEFLLKPYFLAISFNC